MSDKGGSVRAKPSSTRGSIRQTLNFGSVGKALADVMNKDRNDPKSAKRAEKESHRSGSVGIKPRASLDATPSKRARTPDSKTITARRRSSLATASLTTRNSVDRNSTDSSAGQSKVTPQHPSAQTRSSVLRPRPGSASNLPKYRPKSIVAENGNPPKPGSPGLSGSRKRPSSSDEEKSSSGDMAIDTSSASKESRPISPLPQRVKNHTAHSKPKPPTPKADTPSSVRLAKTTKLAGSIPRPSSSSSSSSSISRTPQEKGSSRTAIPESPLVRHARQRSRVETPPAQQAGNMSHISEADSDNEEEDVEILLGPVAAPGAPTPAMPRLQTARTRSRLVPATPTKPALPMHFEPPLASSTPPRNRESPSFLRTNPSPASDRSLRGGSILSWEQLANEASRTIPVDELGTMLSDMAAPFQQGPLSPVPTGNGSMLLDVNMPPNLPSSPGLSAFNSPSGYGSISHVLLPNVTPSPAVRSQRMMDKEAEGPAVDTAIATLLRLQLSSAENTAKERLMRLQVLEEEIHNLKMARAQETEALSQQVSILEAQLKNSLDNREQSEEEQVAYTASLEEQLRQAHAHHQQALREVSETTRQKADASWRSTMERQNRKVNAACAASVAAREWRNIQQQCENELDVVAADKETLQLLLGQLDLARQQIVAM